MREKERTPEQLQFSEAASEALKSNWSIYSGIYFIGS
jgi:hypothetical protein